MKYSILPQKYSIDLCEKDINEIPSIIKEVFNLEAATIILKQKNGALVGRYLDGNCEFYKNTDLTNEDMFIDIRVFNENREVYIWKGKEKIKCRHITDSGEETTDCFNEKLLLWGTAKNIDVTHFMLEEEKIKPIAVPYIEGIKENNEVFLEIKNYLGKSSVDGVPYIKYWRAVRITK